MSRRAKSAKRELLRILIRVLVYARVSTGAQAQKDCDSCESQISVCRKFAADQPNWTVVGALRDERTGRNDKRPGFQELKKLIASREVDVVLAYRSNRIFRNAAEAQMFEQFAREHGVQLVFTGEPYAAETAAEKFTRGVFWNMGEMESNVISENVRRAIKTLAENGRTHGGVPSYGYETHNNRLFQVEAEAAVVRECFEMAARGMTSTEIANDLNRRGFRYRRRTGKTGKNAEMDGGPFRADQVLRILRSPIPKGTVRHARTGEEFPGLFDAIVDERLWAEANAALDAQVNRREGRVYSRDKYFYALKGLIECSCCGSRMTPTQSGKLKNGEVRYHYYTCSRHRRLKQESKCRVRSIPARTIERVVLELFAEIANQPGIAQKIVESQGKPKAAQIRKLKSRKAEVDRDLRRLDHEIRRVAEALKTMKANAVTEVLVADAEALTEQKQELLIQSVSIRNEIEAHQGTRLSEHAVREGFKRFSDAIGTLPQEEQRELHRLLIQRISILPNPKPSDTAHLERKRPSSPRREITVQVRFRSAVLKTLLGEVSSGLGPPAVTARKILEVNTTVAYARSRPAIDFAILEPFQKELGNPPTQRKRPIKNRHELHRARQWQEEMERNKISQAALGRLKKISRAGVTHVLSWLKLSPCAQQVLLGLEAPSQIRKISRRFRDEILGMAPSDQVQAIQKRMANKEAS